MNTRSNRREKPEEWRYRRAAAKYAILRPIMWVEWITEWVVHFLRRWAFIEFLEYAGRFSVLVAVFFYVTGHGDRLKEKHYQAWQVINAAQGKPGTGGRIDALQDLNNDGVSLAGVDLSGRARLRKIRLPGADLKEALFTGATLDSADLHGAKLQGATLSGADLRRANLQGADLTGAGLDSANLYGALLQGAILVAGASLKHCILAEANFSGASVWQADFSGADLMGARLEDSYFLTREQVLSASDWRGARLPAALKSLELSPNASPEDLQRAKAEALETSKRWSGSDATGRTPGNRSSK